MQLKRWLRALTTYHRPDGSPPVFLFSNARSGSSWLMELIATQPGVRFVDEPLSPAQFSVPGAPLPPTWDFLLPHPEREERLGPYFDDLLAGRCSIGAPSLFSKFYRPYTWRIVLKILRCHDLMNWFEQRYHGRVVYLLRHPIPTNLSRTVYPRLSLFLDNDEYCHRYLTADQREFGRQVLSRGSELEKKVLDWALQNLPPLRFLDRQGWLCLHYEDLVLDAKPELERMASHLELPHVKRMLKRATVPSQTIRISERRTQQHFAEGGYDRSFLLRRWRERVSEAEEQRVFELLSVYGLNEYARGEDLPVRRVEPRKSGTAHESASRQVTRAGHGTST